MVKDQKNLDKHTPDKAAKSEENRLFTPFESAEEAWFWFLDAYQAKHDGARISAGLALVPRPCEPLDILHSLDRLYRNRRLIWDHLLVLKHYGQRRLPPDKSRAKEVRAYYLWHEALKRLEEVLIRKNIVRERQDSISIRTCPANKSTSENLRQQELA